MRSWLLILTCAACSGAPAEPPPEWPGQATIASDAGRLWVHVAGDPAQREVLVTVHGGPGMASDYLVGLDALAESPTDLAVARYDQRGCGKSREGFQGASFDMATQVEDLLRVCTAAAGDRPVHLLGHSWGGLVAAMFASSHPERVRSLTLVSSLPADGASSREADVEMALHQSKLAEQQVIESASVQLLNANDFRKLLPVYFRDAKFAIPDELRNASFAPMTYFATIGALGRDYDFTADMRAVRCPVLIVFGDSDPFGEAMGRSMETALDNAKVEWFDLSDCGHFWHENPGPFFERLRQFYRR